MGIDNIYLFIAAGLLLNLTPGPDVLYIMASGVRGGARSGMVAALGITAGCFVHIVAAALGVSALIAASATAFTVLKWLGAAYLVYVGFAMLWPQEKSNAIDLIASCADDMRVNGPNDSNNLKTVFLRGFWTNALNPKVAVFFLAFLPQFISPDAPNKTLSFALLGLLFNLNAIPINMGYALGAAWVSKRVSYMHTGIGWLERGTGALFVYFGIKLALSDNRT
jgi:threonine/homoserine/homoserine lactone efflux protein